MATSKTRSLLSVDRWGQIMGFHPLHLNQVEVPFIAPATTCGNPVFQYSWQDADHVGREEIAQAIAQAEAQITRHTNFPLLPSWIADERIIMPRPFDRTMFFYNNTNIRNQRQGVQVNYGHLISGGIESKYVILAGRPVVYTDTDSDTYFETATITCLTAVTSPDEIAIYYPSESGSDDWEIRPITVTISGGTATITCRREQLVKKELLEQMGPESVLGTDNANFLTTVDVYRHYHDPQQQAQFIWENGCENCGGDGCGSCTLTVQNGCITIRDNRRGLISMSPGTWNADTLVFDSAEWSVCRSPDRARVWYRAGYKNNKLAQPNIQLDPEWERVIAFYAASMLDRPLCECANLRHVVEHYQEDLSLSMGSPGNSSSYKLTNRILENPLGTTRGAVLAWSKIKREMVGESILI